MGNICFKLVKEYEYFCEFEKKITHSPKIGTSIRQMGDGGFETNDGKYTYFWHTHITERPKNWIECECDL